MYSSSGTDPESRTHLTVQCLLTVREVRVVRADTQLCPSCAVQDDPVSRGAAYITVLGTVLTVLLCCTAACTAVYLSLPERRVVVAKHEAVCNNTARTCWYTGLVVR